VIDNTVNSRLVNLESGSNFRDMGGYPTQDSRQVKRGLLFRSGSMTGLTDADKTKLNQMGFKSVIDLRSNDEIALLPNTWATASVPNYVQHFYPMAEMEAAVLRRSAKKGAEGYERIYPHLHSLLKPQLLCYFDALTNEEVPLVVNCTAGQDRTGVAAAIVLRALGVEREVIYQDYLLSPGLRRPRNEWGDVDIEEAAKTNDFAAAMLKNRDGLRHDSTNPLTMEDGTPFLELSFRAIDSEYGNFEQYLANELGIDSQALDHLCSIYVE
jgi:protein-tyrosine phosphatase